MSIFHCRVTPGALLLLSILPASVLASGWSGMDAGRWHFEAGDASCRLIHSVPGFGDAVFERTAKARTQITLHGLGSPRSRTIGTLIALPPAWRHDQAVEPLGRVWREPGKQPFLVTPDVAERALLKLEHGMGIAIHYTDPDDALAARVIGLTPIASAAAIESFWRCNSELPSLPRELFDRIQVYFDTGSVTLNAEARQRLDDAVNRVRYEADIARLEVVGYADTSGPALRNEELSRQRMLQAVDHLIARGVPPGLIESSYRGESGAADKGLRRHERRVAVHFVREEP